MMKKMDVLLMALAAVVFTGNLPAEAVAGETVTVKYRGPVDLAPFNFEWVSRSSVVNRLCYDAKERYIVVNLTGAYYHYCEIPSSVVSAWRQAESMGRYYNAVVKGNYDCRVTDLPMGKMTGAEWKKLEPRATELEDDKLYYRDQVRFSPPRWYLSDLEKAIESAPDRVTVRRGSCIAFS